MYGTPCLIRTDSQLLLRESALPISVKGHISKHTSHRHCVTTVSTMLSGPQCYRPKSYARSFTNVFAYMAPPTGIEPIFAG